MAAIRATVSAMFAQCVVACLVAIEELVVRVANDVPVVVLIQHQPAALASNGAVEWCTQLVARCQQSYATWHGRHRPVSISAEPSYDACCGACSARQRATSVQATRPAIRRARTPACATARLVPPTAPMICVDRPCLTRSNRTRQLVLGAQSPTPLARAASFNFIQDFKSQVCPVDQRRKICSGRGILGLPILHHLLRCG